MEVRRFVRSERTKRLLETNDCPKTYSLFLGKAIEKGVSGYTCSIRLRLTAVNLFFGFLTDEGLQEECNPFHSSQAGPQEAGGLRIAWHTFQEILSIRELEGIAGALPVDWRTTNSGSTAISGTNSPLPSIRANNVRAASSPIFWSG